MQILEDDRNLSTVELRRVGVEAARVAQVREELAADDVLEHHVQVARVLEGAREVHDEGVVRRLEDGLLPDHVLDLLQADHLALLEDLDRPVRARALVRREPHAAERARAERHAHVEVVEPRARELRAVLRHLVEKGGLACGPDDLCGSR